MGLFGKKYCNFCGQKIRMMQNTRIDGGNLCRDCREKLSPFYMIDYEEPTVAEVEEHLQYREQNRMKLRNFQVTECIGETCRMYIDGGAREFVLATEKEFAEGNPDVFAISSVIRAEAEGKEIEDEHRDGNDERRPHSTYSYAVMLDLELEHPILRFVSYQVHPKEIYTNRGRIDIDKMRQVYEEGAQVKGNLFPPLPEVPKKIRRNTCSITPLPVRWCRRWSVIGCSMYCFF